MDTNGDNKVKMFFFPYIAGGHLLPMIDIAKVFASSHPLVDATVITTPKTAALFQSSLAHGPQNLSFLTLQLPNNDDENFLGTVSLDQRAKISASFKTLKEPLQKLLYDQQPHCFVSDLLHSWTIDIAENARVPWVVFHSTSLFVLCVEDHLARFKPHREVGSVSDSFVLSGLKNESVKLTNLMLPLWHRPSDKETPQEYLPINLIRKACSRSYAMVVNSCSVFEGEFRDRAQAAVGASRVCLVGPVSLNSSRNVTDAKVVSGESDIILNWLNSNTPNSVVYVSFGSEANLCKAQFHEIALGLEGSGRPFIWVVRPNLFKDQGDEEWFPEGFESRVRDSNQGLIIKDWAPQLVILGHVSVGAFVTHCGWNSFLEGLSNGVPMITWPLTHDQFYIESLIVDVLKVGIRAGNKEWLDNTAPPKVAVTRDQVETSLTQMMGGGEEVDEMRRNVKEYAKKCKVSVREGGSSYEDACALVEELKARKLDLSQK
ncbi:hypothetical protein vseg_009792 [Gypsophila vaccaria]